MSSFCLNNGFRLQKTDRVTRRWKQPPKKPIHHVSRDKILHDSWSISAALARGFSDRHFERGEGPGDEVVQQKVYQVDTFKSAEQYMLCCHVLVTNCLSCYSEIPISRILDYSKLPILRTKIRFPWICFSQTL